MIQEEYVSFETAKLLNTKGFKGEFHKHYWGYEPGKEFLTDGSFNPEYDYPAPTLQMAMKWLREVHNIAIETEWEHLWYAYIKPMTAKPFEEDYYQCESSKYEEACEAAILYCLKNLI